MKRIEAIIASEKIGVVVEELKKIGIGGLTIIDAKGWGKGKRSQMAGSRGTDRYIAEFNTRNYIITIVDDSLSEKVISTIADTAGTGSSEDGKIFVVAVEDAIDIGSKQKGIHAI